MKKLLIYVGKENIDIEKMKNVLDSIKLEYSFLSDNDLETKMSELLDKEENFESRGKKHSFIYVDGNEIEEIQNLDKVLKENDVDIVRKACKTETNIEWKLEDLIKEVEEEYEYFQLKDHLYSLVVSPDQEKIKSDENYLKLMSMAFALLQDEKAEKEILEIAVKSIERYEKG